jgi:hypothetical protein
MKYRHLRSFEIRSKLLRIALFTAALIGARQAAFAQSDAGIIYNPNAGQPCGNAPAPIFDSSTSPATLKGTCNGYQGYSRFAPVRTSYPTEQLTLQSRYFRRLDISARGAYSSADTKVDDFSELFLGLLR